MRLESITSRGGSITFDAMIWGEKNKRVWIRHIYFFYPISISQLLLKSYELLRLVIVIRIWFSFWWQVAACTRTATKILVSCLGKKQSALRWPVVKKTNATSTTTLPRLPSLKRSPLRLTALQREKSWERPLYWQLVFHFSFKYFKTFLWQVSLRDKLAAFDLLHGV